MGEETKVSMDTQETSAETPSEGQEQGTATAEPTTTTIPEEGSGVRDDVTLKPLFEEPVSESELRGEVEDEATAAEEGESSETEKTGSSPPEDEEGTQKAAGGDDDEKGTSEGESEAGIEARSEEKPPLGYVPIAALHEERRKRKELAAKVDELLTRFSDSPEESDSDGGTADVDENFKVLTDEEFDALVEEDPQEAIRYQARLRQYEAKQRAQEEHRRRAEEIVRSSIGAVIEAIPDYYNEDGKTARELAAFAAEHGFSGDMADWMTDPRTLIIPPNAEPPMLLGEGAASLLKMIHALHEKSAKANPEKVRAELEEEITKEVTAKVTKELLEKFKKDPAGTFRDIGEIPGSGDDIPPAATGLITEEQFARMSEEERRVLLGG